MRRLLLVAALALVVSSIPVASQTSGGAFTILVKGAEAAFSHDAWKDEQPVTGDLTKNTPFPAVPNLIGTYKNPYFGQPHYAPAGPLNGWGYVLNLTLELGDANRQPIKDPVVSLFIDAKIPVGDRAIPAKLAKTGPTTFRATFDLDGEVGKSFPALLGGSVPVEVTVYEQPATAQPRAIGSDAFIIRSTYAVSTLPAVAFPREALQVYSDLGNLTPLATRSFAPDDAIPITFAFGVPNATVRALLLNTRTTFTTFEGRTDAGGLVSFTVTPSDVLGASEGGLVVVEAHLLGSPISLSFGNGLVILPVQSHATSVVSVAREVRAGEDDPAATVRITVADPDAGPQVGGRHGRIVALDGVRVLANVPFLPADPSGDVNHKVARYLARQITEARVSTYSLYSLLFTERNEFYSLATATRGYAISASPAAADTGERGTLTLVVRNLNNNGDTVADFGLASTVRVEVTGLPGGGNWSGDVSVAEGLSQVVEIPFASSSSGTFAAVVNSTSDELRLDRTVTLEVRDPPGVLDGFFSRLIPAGPLAPLLLFILVSAAGLRSRHRRA